MATIILWSCLGLSVAQQSSQCLAVITEIKGDANLKKAGKDEFVKTLWGTQLYKGDQIKTSDKSEIKLLFSNGSIISIGPTSMITISGKESPATEASGGVKNISSAMMVDLSALTIKDGDKKDVDALAGLRSDNADKIIESTSPFNSFIKTNRPSFSWGTKEAFDNYKVNLYNSRGLVWSKKVPQSSMTYPENEKELEFGESYFWNVEGEGLIKNIKSDNYKFSLISLEKSKEVEKNEQGIKAIFKDEPESSSLHTVLGAYYINQRLLQDAIIEFQIISKLNSNSPLPHEILGSLYSDVGEKDKAIEELQRALALAKDKDR